MSALSTYLQHQQNRACQLVGMLEAIHTLDNGLIAPEVVTTLIDLALTTAHEINDALDSTALPKEGEA